MDVSPWDRWLRDARELPADLDLWCGVHDFIQALAALAGEKRHQAHERWRRRISELIRGIAQDYGTLLQYLGLRALTDPDETSPHSGWDEVKRLVDDLRGSLVQIAALRQRTCDTFDEEDERAQAIRMLRAEAHRIHHSLTVILDGSIREPAVAEAAVVEAVDAAPALIGKTPEPKPELKHAAKMGTALSAEVPLEPELEQTTEAIASSLAEPVPSPPAEPVPSPPAEPVHTPPAEPVHTPKAITFAEPVPEPVHAPEPIPSLSPVAPPDSGPVAPTSLADQVVTEEFEAPQDVATPAPAAAIVETTAANAGSPVMHGHLEFSSLNDAALHLRVSQALSIDLSVSSEQLVKLLGEQQRRWLRQGQLLRGYMAAQYLEDRHLDGESAALVPTWLCWLMLLLTDPGASRIAFKAQEYAGFMRVFCSAARPVQPRRFLFCWYCAALLGPQADRAMQLAAQLQRELWSDEWAHHPFFYFCERQLIHPTQQGKKLRFPTKDTPEVLRRRIKERVEEADGILTFSNNYRNGLVKRFWTDLVGRGGPVQRLLEQARSDGLRDPLPNANMLASEVREWPLIESVYRRNMENRLDKFLDDLREVQALQRQLRLGTEATERQIVLPAAEIERALEQAPELERQLKAEGCPSLAGLNLLVERLRNNLEGSP